MGRIIWMAPINLKIVNFQEGRLAAIARLDLVELETYVDSVEKPD